jgi:hypothetical protein
MPYTCRVKDVVELAGYLAAARDAGLDDETMAQIVDAIAETPDLGDLIVGAGGARKFRWAAKGKGKRGGARVISYYPGAEKVFLIDVYAKNDRADLTPAERNVLRKLIAELE